MPRGTVPYFPTPTRRHLNDAPAGYFCGPPDSAPLALAGVVSATSGEDVLRAVKAGRRTLPTWRELGPQGHVNCLTGCREALRSGYGGEGEPTPRKSLVIKVVGKRLREADLEVAESADMLECVVQHGAALLAQAIRLDQTLWATG
jgi:delta 1-pyrroline-5-carboxylate dehydrogenase